MGSTPTLKVGTVDKAAVPGARTDPLPKSRFYAFPPSYTLQPNATSRASQLRSWSGLVQQWCAFRHQFRLNVADALDSPLFHNAAIGRRLNHAEALAVLEFMVSGKTGLPAGATTTDNSSISSSSWVSVDAVSSTAADSGSASSAAADTGAAAFTAKDHKFEQRAEWISADRTAAWIYWRRPEEWAELLAEWVEATGQKGVVLTLYELTQGEATADQDFYDMPEELLKRSLAVLARRGKAQVFGTSGTQGVKFF